MLKKNTLSSLYQVGIEHFKDYIIKINSLDAYIKLKKINYIFKLKNKLS